MFGPSKHVSTNQDGSLHESVQGPTSPDGSWSRTSSDHHDDGAQTGIHVTAHDGPSGEETIINIPTENHNVGDQYGNFDSDDEE